MAFDYRDGYGNCPPGYYRPSPMYDCRPQVSGQVYQQQNLEQLAAHYNVQQQPTQGQGIQSTGAPSESFYNAQPPPAVSAPVQPLSGGGFDLTTLLLIGAALFLVMKK